MGSFCLPSLSCLLFSISFSLFTLTLFTVFPLALFLDVAAGTKLNVLHFAADDARYMLAKARLHLSALLYTAHSPLLPAPIFLSLSFLLFSSFVLLSIDLEV